MKNPRKKILFADFETTNIEKHWINKYKNVSEYFENEEDPIYPEIYSWCVGYPAEYRDKRDYNKPTTYGKNYVNLDGMIYHIGNGIESFFEFMNEIPKNIKICFNNSRGFDAHFIVPYLTKNNNNYVKNIALDSLKPNFEDRKLKVLHRISQKLKKAQEIRFKEQLKTPKEKLKYLEHLLNTNESQWDTLFVGEWSSIVDSGKNIKILTYMNKKGKKIEIIDNLDLFPMSVAEMGKLLNKMFKTLEFSKLELDSNYERSEKYNSLEELKNDGNEVDYLMKDVEILCKFNLMMREKLGFKNCKMTTASTTYKMWKNEFAQELLPLNPDIEKVIFKNGLTKYRYQRKLFTDREIGDVVIEKILPTSWLDKKDENGDTFHRNIYRWYFGGLAHLNVIYQGGKLRNITSIDINSSYPAIMLSSLVCPIGEPTIGDDKNKPFKFYKVIITKKVSNKNGLPFVFRENGTSREYVSNLKIGEIFRMTTASIKQFKKYYNIDKSNAKIVIEYSFAQTTLNKIFGKFISKWYKLKEEATKNGDEALKKIAKLLLTALYGKLCTKSIRESKYWNEIKEIWTDYEEILESDYYLPLGVVITEYARMKLVEVVGNNYKNFVYCDTDSLFFNNWETMNKEHIDLHPTKIGAWDIEMKGGNGVVRRPKQYYFEYKENGKNKKKIAFAGINFDRYRPDNSKEKKNWEKWIDCLTEKDFILGRKINGQLNTFKPTGGSVVFNEVIKEIKPIWDYAKKTEQIYCTEQQFRDNYFGKEK